MGKRKGVHRFLVGKLEVKRPLGRPRGKWEDNKIDPQEVGCGCVEWIEVVQDRYKWPALVTTVIKLRVP